MLENVAWGGGWMIIMVKGQCRTRASVAKKVTVRPTSPPPPPCHSWGAGAARAQCRHCNLTIDAPMPLARGHDSSLPERGGSNSGWGGGVGA